MFADTFAPACSTGQKSYKTMIASNNVKLFRSGIRDE